ncbi:MAG: lmo0937 family membrane protein [Ignavibacteriales bacterium]|nr:lmo0937 family membrane protein [Ignavibacteriales bacterium]
MLYTIAVVLIVLWLLGFLAFPVAGGLIHVLLVIAIIMILLRVISGRRVL